MGNRVRRVFRIGRTIIRQSQLGVLVTAEYVQPAIAVVVDRVGKNPPLDIPGVADFVIAPAGVNTDAGVIKRPHDTNPVPELLLELCGTDPCAIDQVAGENHQIDVPLQDIVNQFCKDLLVNAGYVAASAVAGHDETPRFGPRADRRPGQTDRHSEMQKRAPVHKLVPVK